MKKSTLLVLLLISYLSNAQKTTNDYVNLWEKVYEDELKSLPKSALSKVDKIYTKATKENNEAQKIKCLIYQSKFYLTLEENAQLKIVTNFKSEIETSNNKASKAIINSLLAHIYWEYFKKNRYRFYKRTTTTEIVNTDFRTWDINTLYTEIHKHLKASLTDKNILKNTKYDVYKALIIQNRKNKNNYLTLFDFLAHQALEFYEQQESSITKPKEPFLIDKKEYLTEIETYHFKSSDLYSNKYLSLKLYQELIQLHKNHPEEYFTTVFQAIDYIKINSNIDDFNQIHLSYLKSLQQKNKASKQRAILDFEIAKVYYNTGKSYTLSNTAHQYDYNKAIEICNQLITEYPKHKLVDEWKQLIKTIEHQELSLMIEQYNPIHQQIKTLITYKNTDVFYGTIYKLNDAEYNQIKNENDYIKKNNLIKKLPVFKEWKSDLKNIKDHQKHSTEILLPKIPRGQYIITGGYHLNEKTNHYTFFQVTNLTLLKNQDDVFQVLHRINGTPFEKAKIHLDNKNSNYRNNATINKNFVTDKNGSFNFITKKYYSNVTAKVSTETDTAFFENIYLSKKHTNYNKEKTYHQAFVFTDRSIYRPGQEVFFKAIVLKKKGESTELLSNESIEIGMYDVNNQEIKKLNLELNEFGTTASTFKIPEYGLNGVYSFRVYQNDKRLGYVNTQISVEEYKRPKFETTFKPVTNTYKVNDAVTVTGEATALSGSKITDAKVVYRVVRKAKLPRWCWWINTPSPTEIENGETITDLNGNYDITFKALPDDSLDKKTQPTFYYTIYADVTDINGETRSTETEIAVGYHTLNLTLSVDGNINVTDKNKIQIDSENLNGEFVATQGELKIYKLIAPETVYRKRPWNTPDLQTFSKKEYKKLFPFESYEEEDQSPSDWEKGTLVFSKDFDTEKKQEITLSKTKKWALGKYIVIAESKDKWGQLVKDEQIITLYNPKAKKIADNQLFQIYLDKKTYQPKEEVLLSIGSSVENITVFVEIEKDHKTIATHQIKLNNDIKQIKIPVTENDRGGFAVKWHRVNYNAIDTGVLNISVPYKSTDLSIETITFRDLLEPGAHQKWSFKIKGPQQQKATAEVLASMYDASLDQFKSHSWGFNPIHLPIYSSRNYIQSFNNFNKTTFRINNNEYLHYYHNNSFTIDRFNWFGFSFVGDKWDNQEYLRRINYLLNDTTGAPMPPPPPPTPEQFEKVEDDIPFMALKKESYTGELSMDKRIMVTNSESNSNDSEFEEVVIIDDSETKKAEQQLDNIKPRTNFNETAFFFPQLRTDEKGEVSFEFTMPEDLTRWKLQLLAHDKELNSSVKTLTTVTQKQLMVIPNTPRFLREGDEITLSTKIANLTEDVLQGQVKLELTDAVTGKNIDGLLQNNKASQIFSVDKKGNTSASWTLQIPENVSAIQYKIVATANDFSDGEQNVIPVLSNRMLVTETLPLWVNEGETKTFTLDGLKNNTSSSIKNHQLTLEITSNPAWYAVQALPYLMEYPHECAEQTFARYYANQLASHIVSSNPKIKEVFHQWKNSDALISNLEKNQELKSIIIQETPWLRDAQSETEQKKRIALLFDLSKMENNLARTIKKLEKMQFSSGAFPWFSGSDYPNRNITQHIVQGFEHLKHLGIIISNPKIEKIISKAQSYLDDELIEDYERLLKQSDKIKFKAKTEKKGIALAKDYMNQKHIHSSQLQYLYIRSFNKNEISNEKLKKAIDYYFNQSTKFWIKESLYNKGLIALIQYRNQQFNTANAIVKSLEENSITNDEMGMYWKENKASWYWYQSPIETQSLLIETFSEIKQDTKTTDNLKKWLLKNKQTQQWKTTKATSEAIYALLLQGSDWLSVNDAVAINIGGKKLNIDENIKVEAGTGYFKTKWNAKEIDKNMATVSLTKKGKGVAWGGLYWQYFEDLDKIKSANTPLKINKKVFIKNNTSNGIVLKTIDKNTSLKVGDLLTVRIELTTDRNIEFIHMKDMRASGIEPIDVLSGYKRQDGLGYYQSTKDTATHFFFDKIRKGIYVFEYDLRISHKGTFSNGITTIQSMYAPEFGSHSKGIKIEVE